MNKKKIGLIILLIVIIGIVVFVIVNSNEKQEKNTTATNTTLAENRTTLVENNTESNLKKVTVSTLNDGILYSTTAEQVKADIVVGDNYFDTQMADMNMNFSSYEGKTIEIEGMYLESTPYTFVGRYSTSNLCADCPVGYSYFEYEFKANELPKLKDEKDWIKVIGTLKRAYDANIGSEYYYIDVISLQVMNEKGLDTVSN